MTLPRPAFPDITTRLYVAVLMHQLAALAEHLAESGEQDALTEVLRAALRISRVMDSPATESTPYGCN